MANTLTAIVPKILAMGLLALRELCVMPRLVNADYSRDAAKFGSTIDVPLPTAQTVTDVSPSNTPPAPANTTPTVAQIPLNKWKKTNFFLTDKDMKEIDRNQSFYPMQVSEAVRALANKVNAEIFAEYTGVYGYVGTAGTTPFGSAVTDAINLRKALNQQLCPADNRRGVLSFDAEANALALAAFSNFEQTGDMAVKIEGKIGRKFGVDWYADNVVPTHTAGTASGTLINSSGVAVGDTSVAIDTGTGTFVVGDIFTVAGDSQTYVVTAAVADVSAGTLAFLPAAKVAWANNAAVTRKASHVVNLGFHRDAFAFANRPVADVEFKGGNMLEQMTDPMTGISLALEISRQHHQTVWEFSILYGVKLVRPELAVRLAG